MSVRYPCARGVAKRGIIMMDLLSLLWPCLLVAMATHFVRQGSGFVIVPTGSPCRREQLHALCRHSAIKIPGYDDAFRVIDECAVRGESTDDLYDSVRFIDKNAMKIYPTLQEKQDLWERARGSWKLQLATGGGKYTTFRKVPIFAFAMIDEHNFGNGVGWNQDAIIFSLLGPHFFNPQRRQMVITIDDMYVGSNLVTNYVPSLVKNTMGLGKRPDDYHTPQRPPAFTMIGASDDSLVARGGSGGIAIWSRLQHDIRPAAYGNGTEL